MSKSSIFETTPLAGTCAPTLPPRDWQNGLGEDVAALIRADLAAGLVPWIAYAAEDLGGRLVREYADGRREYVSYVDERPVLTSAPYRSRL